MDRPLNRLLPLIALAVLAGVWTWWALDAGAYFGLVFYPGAVILIAALVVLLLTAPWRGHLHGAPLIALVALALIAVRIAVSIIWSPAPEAALSDAERAALYAVAFALGLWTCHLLGRRMGLALLPFAVAGGDRGHRDRDLGRYGRRCLAAGRAGRPRAPARLPQRQRGVLRDRVLRRARVATDRDRDWRLRGTMVGTATLCAGLVVLSQSRGSVIAAAAGIVAFVVMSRVRLRAVLYLATALLPVALVLPLLLDVYSTAADGEDVLDVLHQGAAALGGVSVLAALIGGAAARAGAELEPSPKTGPARRARR